MVAPTLMPATIPVGQMISNVIDCSAAKPLRCRMPADWTKGGTDMITFQCASLATGPWIGWSMIVVPNAVVPIEGEFGAKVVDTFIRVKCSIPQAADRTFTFVMG